EKTPDVAMSAGQLSKLIHESGLGVPHSTRLKEALRKSGKVNGNGNGAGFRLKALSRTEIRGWVRGILGTPNPTVDQDLGYLPRGVWVKTRSYIEKVCVQLNA